MRTEFELTVMDLWVVRSRSGSTYYTSDGDIAVKVAQVAIGQGVAVTVIPPGVE